MNTEQQSYNQTVQGVFPADDADETDGARTVKRGGRKDRGAEGGLASFLSAGSAISALKTSWLLFPKIHPRPSALSAENCWGEFCLGSKLLRNCITDKINLQMNSSATSATSVLKNPTDRSSA